MNINVYLPDEIGERAKDEDLNLSRLLRDAVIDELERRRIVSETLNEPKEYLLDLEDRNGGPYQGRITGREIAYDELNDLAVYLTEDERVIIYDGNRLSYHELDDPSDLEQWRDSLDADTYRDAMIATGQTPIVDL